MLFINKLKYQIKGFHIMTFSRKYKSFGIRRENNLSDVENTTQSLDNLLNNLPGVDEENDITFISNDLDAIRGLKDTNIEPESFFQLAGTAPRETILTQTVGPDDEIITSEIDQLIEPRIRLQDRFNNFRKVTETPPVFASGRGPRAYFFPSTLLPTITKNSSFNSWFTTNKTNTSVQTSDDYWVFGEFIIRDRIKNEFPNSYGGILWEGYFIPNPSSGSQLFGYTTSGLFQVEYRRNSTSPWQILKSIYAKKRSVIVSATFAGGVTDTIELAEGETRFVSVGDLWDLNNDITIVAINGNIITLSAAVGPISAGNTIVFDMELGTETYVGGEYSITDILDRGETPQLEKRIFWWYPNVSGYKPDIKYLRNTIEGRSKYDFYFLNIEPATAIASEGSTRELLEAAIIPSQEILGSTSTYRELKSSTFTQSQYIPKKTLAEVTVASTNISFTEGNKTITGTLSSTELGNYIVPTAVADLGPVIPKNLRIKDLLGSNTASTVRIVSSMLSTTRTSYPVNIIDHRGLIDYFVASSSGNIVTITNATTASLKVGMICVFGAPSTFIRITSIINSTQFTTSANLNLTNAFLYIYSNSGIIDRSTEVFCTGVFGKLLAANATAGASSLQLSNVTGIVTGQIVQFGDSIDSNTAITNIVSNTITLSKPILKSIIIGQTIVFAPAGTTVNKELCVLPLDLSPPFVGVATGLSTNGKNIKSSLTPFNVKVNNLTINGVSSPSSALLSESYDRLIQIKNQVSGANLNIIAKKI
jgi:hypothetical protein